MKVLTRCLTSGDRGKRLEAPLLAQRANKPDEGIRSKLDQVTVTHKARTRAHTFAPSFSTSAGSDAGLAMPEVDDTL